MNVTREEINQIIREELREAIKRGELDEGFFDKLIGRGDSPEDLGFVTSDRVKKDLDGVQASLSKLKKTAGEQDNKQLSLAVNTISDKVAGLYSMTTPKGEVGRFEPLKPGEKGPAAVLTSMKNSYDKIKSGSKDLGPAKAIQILTYIYQLKNNLQNPDKSAKDKIEHQAEQARVYSDKWNQIKNDFAKAYENAVINKAAFSNDSEREPRFSASDAVTRLIKPAMKLEEE